MSEQNIFTEAPASWNVRYVDPNGYGCQLTLRSEQGSELLKRAEKALEHLSEKGCIPLNGNGYKGNSHAGSRKDQPDKKNCPIHNVPMKRWEKNGRSWYSHKAPDGSWCKGKANGG